MNVKFAHEKLNVYKKSIEFVSWANDLIKTLPKNERIIDQLDRASISIPLNIAEGNGRYTGKDKSRFFDIARGSAFECAACLDVIVAKNLIDETVAEVGKSLLDEIVSMLVGLIKSSSNRVYEENIEYEA